ncbi:MAG: FUSC family protein, partial [Brevibacterium aurantiacum]|nr:FUSC family protein [Brevibacterium aurantiacum]
NVPLFVVITFLAVFVRQFNPRYGVWGFIAWEAFFFSLYLRPPLDAVPMLALTILISTTWVTALLMTVFAESPSAVLRRTVTAMRAQARSVISACLDVLERPDSARERRTLRREQTRFNEIALLFDARLANSRALPQGSSAARLRRWVIDVEVSIDEVAGASLEIADQAATTPHATMNSTRDALRRIGWGDFPAARKTTQALSQFSTVRPVRRLAWSATILLDAFSDWDTGDFATGLDDSFEDEYDPVVTLIGGNLPSSNPQASKVAQSSAAWWQGAGLNLTNRQAMQAATAAALAITFGKLVAPDRFYWAVMAAFVSFIGTSTADETVRKSLQRVAGTLGGLIAALLLARLTLGNTVLSVVLLFTFIFLAFYLQHLSTVAMIFFITMMLGQLFAVLNTFSGHVLFERLVETALGAIAGIIASVLVFPVSGRSTLMTSRKALFSALESLLRGCADFLVDGDTRDLQLRVLELDAAGRQVAVIAGNLVSVRGILPSDNGRQHRVALAASTVRTARALVPPLANLQPGDQAQLAPALLLIADEAHRLRDLPSFSQDVLLDPPSLSDRVKKILDGLPSEPFWCAAGSSDSPTPSRSSDRRGGDATTRYGRVGYPLLSAGDQPPW